MPHQLLRINEPSTTLGMYAFSPKPEAMSFSDNQAKSLQCTVTRDVRTAPLITLRYPFLGNFEIRELDEPHVSLQ